MAYNYRVQIVRMDDDRIPTGPELVFETSNHDDIFAVLDKLRAKALVPDEEAASLSIGLKIFSESLIRHRLEPPFDALWPHMAAFMKALKAHPALGAPD